MTDQRLPLDVFDGPPPGPERDALILALLLAAPEPATAAQLATGAGLSEADVRETLRGLRPSERDGWVVQEHNDTWQLATAPRFAAQVRRFLRLDRESRLSSAALETLAIVAYQQPVTRAEIETVRGVDSSGVLATLHNRSLIEAVGRLSTPGNPIQYGTTSDFLKHFGLASLADLPPLGQVDGRDVRDALSAAAITTEFRDESPDSSETAPDPDAPNI
jgi:segregation and condensation protein B